MDRVNVRAYILVLVFAVILAAVFALGISQNWGIFRLPTRTQRLNEDAFNENYKAADLVSADLYFDLLPPSSSEEVRQVTFQLTGTDLWLIDEDEEANIAQVCLTAVELLASSEQTQIEAYFNFIAVPLCSTPEEGSHTVEGNQFEVYPEADLLVVSAKLKEPPTFTVSDPTMVSLNFWYPYDGFTLKTALYVEYNVTLDNGTVYGSDVRPYIGLNVLTSGTRLWEVDTTAEQVTIGEDTPSYFAPYTYEGALFTFRRPLLYRLVVPFFMIGMVLLIALVPLLGDRDTLVDICAAMLFGIFGLKGIVGPGEQMGQTILDIALIGLYVVLAFAAVLFFINKVMDRGKAAE